MIPERRLCLPLHDPGIQVEAAKERQGTLLQRISAQEARTKELNTRAQGLQGELEERTAQLQTEVCPAR